MTVSGLRLPEVGLPLVGRPSRLSRARRNGSATSAGPTLKSSFLHKISYVFFLFAIVLVARAHDPYESFTTVVVHPDRMVLTMGMAQSTALRLIDPQVKIPSLTPENMTEHRPRLVREGALLFILTSLRTQLKARKVEVELTDENDIIFTVTYPRPAAGRLLIHAAYLKKLGDGYGGIVNIDDDANHSIGWDQLLWERPNFEANIPSVAPPPKK